LRNSLENNKKVKEKSPLKLKTVYQFPFQSKENILPNKEEEPNPSQPQFQSNAAF
jgi:hypothetical protein